MAYSTPAKRRRTDHSVHLGDSTAQPSSLEKTKPVVIFAHGAGAPSASDWMTRSVCISFSSLYLYLMPFSRFSFVLICDLMIKNEPMYIIGFWSILEYKEV